MLWNEADRQCEPELRRLWTEAFEDKPEVIELFFRQRLKSGYGIIRKEANRVVSAYYLLPARLSTASGNVKAQYLYAAATRKSSRGKGYMGDLLRALDEIGQKRGACCTVLVPSEQSLYDYYARFGFRPYFFRRVLNVGRSALAAFAKEENVLNTNAIPPVSALRNQILSQTPGNLLWDEEAFRFAAALQQMEGGKLLQTGSDGGGYLFFQPGKAQIGEWIGSRGAACVLAGALLRQSAAEEFLLSLPVNSPLFAGEGKIVPYGMLRMTVGCSGINAEAPYLGLEMA